jgi:hypothetical protein
MTRLRRLIATALVDSFGLSLGWTVFSLHVVRGHGLAGLGLCNAAMLVGVALSAPVAARLSARLDGRALLRSTAATEAALRVGTFALLLAGAPCRWWRRRWRPATWSPGPGMPACGPRSPPPTPAAPP